jgi:hypothetical protein
MSKMGNMKKVMRMAGVGLVMTLGGCATMGSMYSSCDQKSASFAEAASCTKTALKEDSRYGFHGGYIRYANRAIAALDVLEEKVAAGAMTEKEARYNMQEVLASMQTQIASDVNAINASSSRTIRTNCTTFGSTTNCTSR